MMDPARIGEAQMATLFPKQIDDFFVDWDFAYVFISTDWHIFFLPLLKILGSFLGGISLAFSPYKSVTI